jgi:hypothetical protein
LHLFVGRRDCFYVGALPKTAAEELGRGSACYVVRYVAPGATSARRESGCEAEFENVTVVRKGANPPARVSR